MALTGNTPLVAPLTGRDTGLSDAGAVFVALTPTPGTGIISFATPTTFAIGELNPHLMVINAGNLNIYPLYVRFLVTVAPVAGVLPYLSVFIDQLAGRTAVAATGLTINNTNIGSQLGVGANVGANPSAIKSGAQISIGVNTLTAATSQRRVVGNARVRATLPVVSDTYGLSFGSPDPVATGMPIEGTLVLDRVINMPAIVLGPGQIMGVVYWAASNSTGVTTEVEFCYGER